MDRRYLFELERHAEEIRQIQAKDRIPDELHIFEPDRTETNAAASHLAGEEGLYHLAPFYLPKAMNLRRFLTWVATVGAVEVTYQAALYRLSNGHAAQRGGARVDGASEGAVTGMGSVMRPAIQAELLEPFTAFSTSATIPEPYRHDLRKDLLLVPGFYGIGYTVSDADGMWFYGPSIGVACGYRCLQRVSATPPLSLEARAYAAPTLHFVLRSALGIRMRPYNEEVNSVW